LAPSFGQEVRLPDSNRYWIDFIATADIARFFLAPSGTRKHLAPGARPSSPQLLEYPIEGMSIQIPATTCDTRISGDTLALDTKIRARIMAETQQLQQRYPSLRIKLQVRVAEEFDQLHGHRVRCELIADLPGRRQLLIREAQKDAFAAISDAFSAARQQLRRSRSRSISQPLGGVAHSRPTGP
jgi:ribosome-associated translation inhibitor RaiA